MRTYRTVVIVAVGVLLIAGILLAVERVLAGVAARAVELEVELAVKQVQVDALTGELETARERERQADLALAAKLAAADQEAQKARRAAKAASDELRVVLEGQPVAIRLVDELEEQHQHEIAAKDQKIASLQTNAEILRAGIASRDRLIAAHEEMDVTQEEAVAYWKKRAMGGGLRIPLFGRLKSTCGATVAAGIDLTGRPAVVVGAGCTVGR